MKTNRDKSGGALIVNASTGNGLNDQQNRFDCQLGYLLKDQYLQLAHH